jgi:hypothetical protein
MEHDRVVAAGDTFLVTDPDGRTDGENGSHAGAYHRDTRHLDRYDLTGDLEPLTAAATRPGERVTYLGRPQAAGARTRHVTRTTVVRPGWLCERLAVSNLTATAGTEHLSVRVGTRFDDLFEVRGYVDDERERTVTTDQVDQTRRSGGVRFVYAPADLDRAWQTLVRVAILDGDGGERGDADGVAVAVGADVDADGDGDDGRGGNDREREEEGERRGDARLNLAVGLAGHETRALGVAVAFGDGTQAREPVTASSVGACVDATESWGRERAERWARETALDVERWSDVTERSRTDLLDLRLEHGLFAAGVPWYATAFGRDSLVAAYQALPLSAAPATATCRYLAARQAETVDEYREAAPGKVLHEERRGELAARGEIPHTPYYGTVDATPLFVTLVHEAWRWTGDEDFLADLWPHVDRALAWCDRSTRTAGGGEGFLAYPTDGHLRHVGWKDSPDGVVSPDGSWVDGPVALAEVQGYVYDARRRGADIARRVGDEERAAALDRAAAALRARFDEAFWVESEGTYAVALDDGERVETVTTNPGHCLWSGIVPPTRAGSVVDRLRSPDVFTGWGLRTLAASHDAYNPQSYHRGSVWPHDTALCALGMARYGFDEAARAVSEGLVSAARANGGGLPELFAGFAREQTVVPVEYGSACEPQAWAAGAPLACLRAVGAVDGPDVDPELD